MRTYQTLSLIGCIIGILLTIGLVLVVGGLMSASDVLMNMSRPTERELQEYTESQKSSSVFVGGTMIAFFIYIIILVVTFTVKKRTKAVGITILVLGIITIAATNLWGIIPFALLLPASIVALRYKPRKKTLQGSNLSGSISSPKSNRASDSNNFEGVPVTNDNPHKPTPVKNDSGDASNLNVISIATENIIYTADEEQQNDEDSEEEDEEEHDDR